MSDPAAPQLENPATPPSPPPGAALPGPVESQVTFTVKLAPGTRLHVTLETRTLEGQPVVRQDLVFENQGVQALGEAPAPVLLEAAPLPQVVQVEIPAEEPEPLPAPAPEPVLTQVALPEIPSAEVSPQPAAEPEASQPAPPPEPAPKVRQPARPVFPRLRDSLLAALRSTGWGFGLALLVYLASRLVALTEYPMYFFTDEAVQTLLATDFVRDGFRNYANEFLPTFFYNVYQYNLSLSVYLQIIPHWLFGNSVIATRGVSVLVTLLPAVTCGLAFRQFFNSRYAWLAVLMLSITPAWFLHSRTAFETSLAVSFYAAFLYFYLRYRNGSPGSLYTALVFAVLAFYTYSPAQMVIAVTALLLFLTDLRFHLRTPFKLVRNVVGLALLLAIPYARFYLEHPDENVKHLQQIGSYWVAPITLLEKLGYYFKEYLAGLNPLYWFFPNSTDIVRHVMGNYGHLLIFSLPFVAWGLVICIRSFRSPAHRLLLIAVLAAPSGAALVGLGITRALFMVIPGSLLGALGLAAFIEWLVRRWHDRRKTVLVGMFVLLAGFNFFLLGDALTNGRTWSTNYGLSGMQYGASQVFARAVQIHQQLPDTKMIMSPSWANGTDLVARFFLPNGFPMTLSSIDTYLVQKTPFDSSTLFILPPEEYQRAVDSKKFADIKVEQTLPWPNGQPGFYFLRMRYVDNIDAIMEQEAADRQVMLTQTVTVDGEDLNLKYSRLDMGPIANLFDGSLTSLVRTEAANPFKLQIDFPKPHPMASVDFHIGSTATTLELTVQVAGEDKPRIYHQVLPETTVVQTLSVDLGGTLNVTSLYIKLRNTFDAEPGHVHLWEIVWK